MTEKLRRKKGEQNKGQIQSGGVFWTKGNCSRQCCLLTIAMQMHGTLFYFMAKKKKICFPLSHLVSLTVPFEKLFRLLLPKVLDF